MYLIYFKQFASLNFRKTIKKNKKKTYFSTLVFLWHYTVFSVAHKNVSNTLDDSMSFQFLLDRGMI